MLHNTRTWLRHGPILAATVALLAAGLPALAQFAAPKADPNQRQVYLVRQDRSDCTNSNVPNVDGPSVVGNVWVTRLPNGTTNVRIAMTASPKTTYHFFLKCVRLLTDITTDEEGVANTSVDMPTNSAGQVFAFDVYPKDGPPGNVFQSAQVSFQ